MTVSAVCWWATSDYHIAPLTQLYLKTLFILFLSPLALGGPGDGPDCHFPKEIVGVGPIPARIRGETFFLF